MVFSSIPFLFFFFPLFLILYYIVPFKSYHIKWKNVILLVFSLFFYAWGEPIYILLMLFSTFLDYNCSRMMNRYQEKKKRKFFLLLSVVINLGLLGFFKYSDFLISIFNNIFHLEIPLLNLGLPIGISFYTFQTMSYTIDVYRRDVMPERNYFTYLTYVSMFPQLIAGPIVRYQTVSEELYKRDITYANFNSGLKRFIQGLFKKVLIANNIGFLWTTISTIPMNELSVMTAWLGILAFAFQIYFDFSAYSDMAIGMGRMLGFHYLENFNYPYVSKSITEFWRRWHISLSTWFRDYVYIPLGGSRVKRIINIRNILIVWLLTGIWHGAAWNFVLWGLYFGILLVIEKFVLKKYMEKWPTWVRHLYACFFILIGWLIFAFDDMSLLTSYAEKMFGIGSHGILDSTFVFYLKNYFIIILVAFIFSIPVYPWIKEKLSHKKVYYSAFGFVLILLVYLLLLLVVISYLVADSYNPFLYFRF